jgi:hypothetical protein
MRFLVLAILISTLFSLSAHAQNACVDVFQGSPTLEQVDSETRGLLLQGHSLEDVRPSMGLIRQWKLKIISRRLSSKQNIEGLAGDLHLLLVEPRLTSLDIFRLLKNGDRFVQAWAEREIIRHGLITVLPVPAIVEGAKRKLFDRLPKTISFLKDREISPELLSRVLDHGVAGEIESLKAIYGRQREIDYARALKPYIQLIVYAVAGSLIQRYQDAQEAKRGAELTSELASTEVGFDELIVELKKQK